MLAIFQTNGSWFSISHQGNSWHGSLGGRMKNTGRFPERLSLNLAACSVANLVAWRSIPDLGEHNFVGGRRRVAHSHKRSIVFHDGFDVWVSWLPLGSKSNGG
mmetsp:Transcript_21829/g.35711  ORF Transcript_21829/g.35711 Transcript_21829/m.35711 type:complete len:103 (+) Transcript_21829:260-568(+)